MERSEQDPCVRGTLFSGVIRNIRSLLRKEKLTRAELEAGLEPADLEYVDADIVPGHWYPIGSYSRMVDFLWEHMGDRRREFMVTEGRKSAETMVSSGAHAALHAKPESWGDRVVHAMTTVANSLYNFMRWTPLVGDNPRVFSIEVTEAEPWPDSLRYGTEGFIQFLAEQATEGAPAEVTSSRPSPDRIIFHVAVRGSSRFG